MAVVVAVWFFSFVYCIFIWVLLLIFFTDVFVGENFSLDNFFCIFWKSLFS